MDNYLEILIMLVCVWFGYVLNDIRRGLKEWKKDKDNKWEINRMTNREWLANMTDEEFARWLCNQYCNELVSDLFHALTFSGIYHVKHKYGDEYTGVLKWLEEESEVGNYENNKMKERTE